MRALFVIVESGEAEEEEEEAGRRRQEAFPTIAQRRSGIIITRQAIGATTTAN